MISFRCYKPCGLTSCWVLHSITILFPVLYCQLEQRRCACWLRHLICYDLCWEMRLEPWRTLEEDQRPQACNDMCNERISFVTLDLKSWKWFQSPGPVHTIQQRRKDDTWCSSYIKQLILHNLWQVWINPRSQSHALSSTLSSLLCHT